MLNKTLILYTLRTLLLFFLFNSMCVAQNKLSRKMNKAECEKLELEIVNRLLKAKAELDSILIPDRELIFNDTFRYKDYLSKNPKFNLQTLFEFDLKNDKVNRNDSVQIRDFTGSIFLAESIFSNTDFKESVDFSSTTFLSNSDFSNVNFYGYSNFKKSNINGQLSFRDSHFFKHLDFSKCKLNGKLIFDNAHLYKNVTFDYSRLYNNTMISFLNSQLPDTISFAYVSSIPNEIDLRVANFTNRNKRNPVLINLYKTDIQKFKLDYIHFKLLLPDSTFKDIDTLINKENELIRFFKGKVLVKTLISNEEKGEVYEALLNNFKKNGQLESYQLLDIEYQEFKWKNSWARWFTWLPQYWWNFGYSRHYVFMWTLFFLILFTLITYIFIFDLLTNVYIIDKIPKNDVWQRKLSIKNFRERIWYSFIFTSFIFFRITLKVEAINPQKKIGTLYLFLINLLGLICMAYIANFIIQK